MAEKRRSKRGSAHEKAVPTLEIAIAGNGITLRDVDIRVLAQLLEASAATLDAVAAEAGLPTFPTSLSAARNGSAAYEMRSDNESWPALVTELKGVVKARGANSGLRVRHNLHRLHQVGAKLGAVRIQGLGSSQWEEPLYLAVPVPIELEQSGFSFTVHGRVIGVNEYAERAVVHVELVDGRRVQLLARDEIVEDASKLFRKKVRIFATAAWDSERESAATAESIEAWSDTDLIAALEELHGELAMDSVSVDVAEWIRGLDS